jgi:hypothetical protein
MSPIGLQSKFDSKALFLFSFGEYGREEGQFNHPKDVTCDHNGNYVVCDTENTRVQIFKGPSEVPTLLSLCWEKIESSETFL